MKLEKIDWLNHGITFAVSVIGIFIAFQLDDWQERSSKQQEVDLALRAVKVEIESNLAVYNENMSKIGAFLDFVDFCEHNRHDGGLLLSRKEFIKATTRFPGRFDRAKVLKKVNDTLSVYAFRISIDVAPTSGISTGNWQAAISSGVLAHLDHQRTVLLTQVYDWTTKDLGYSDDKLYSALISSKDFDDVDQILENYRIIVKVSRMKYDNVKRYYDQIVW